MKKAFLKTAEVLIAIVVGATFLIYIFPASPAAKAEPALGLLKILESNNEFRELVLLNKSLCIDCDAAVRKYLPDRFKYSYQFDMLDISELGKMPDDLPGNKRVYVESLFIAGNSTEYSPRVIKLYYWSR
jgi:hypothetical protein